ncbi:MAG: DUF4173 domain-containing protein, partial [Gemmatimonadales bacterium]
MSTSQAPLARDNSQLVWTAALIVAALGAYIMFDAEPGVNWGIWTAAASVGVFLVARDRGTLDTSLLLILATTIVLAAGAGVTADGMMHGLICLMVMLFLSLAMLLAIAPDFRRITAPFVIASPFVAAGNAAGESFRRVVDLSGGLRSARARATARGVAITIPIVFVFALLLASADPVFAIWRDQVGQIISAWEFIPRLIFFCVLLVIALGAYSYAARCPAPNTQDQGIVSSGGDRRLGATERLILVSSITALFWLFIAVQLSYLFGNSPSVPGSHMSFAEYAQRGFGELTIVATLSVLLIVLSERYGQLNGHEKRLKAITIALLVSVAIMLASAFHRVQLYEAAYGYTVSRLYAQAYMLVLAAGLVALALEVMATVDTGRLFRRGFAIASATFIVLVYWNHEAWIADENIDRSIATGKELDVDYLVKRLSPNAVPVVVARLATIPEPTQSDLRRLLASEYGSGRRLRNDRWFEWNYRRQDARAALARTGIKPAPAKPAA